MFASVQYLQYFLLSPAAYGRISPPNIDLRLESTGMSGRKAPERRVRAIAAFDGNVYFLSCEAILLRIFLVDDNATARGTIKAALQEHAEWVVVGEACNGRQALENFPAHRPGLTVMDFIMPEMNGLEAARRLTRSDPNTLILMITTDPSTELEKEAKRAGIRGMCAKDKMHSLVDAIDTLLRGETYFPQATAA